MKLTPQGMRFGLIIILLSLTVWADWGGAEAQKLGAASPAQTTSVAAPTQNTTELAVDDGTFEDRTGLNSGGTSHRVNRLTPSSYPSTLNAVGLYFPSGAGANVGDTLVVEFGTNPDGDANINGISLQLVNTTIPVLNQFFYVNVSGPTIGAGDFVVGMRYTVTPQGLPFAIDLTPPYRQRSYRSTNGFSFDLTGSANVGTPGNYGIRARVTIPQQCSFSISPTGQNFSAGGGTGSVSVTASASGCNWTATSNANFITITSGTGGNGNGTVNYSVAANSNSSGRFGNLTIAGRQYSVLQVGTGAACAITPISIGQTINGTLSTSDCRSPAFGDAYYADLYSFNATAGQQVAISMSSSEVDAFLDLLNPSRQLIATDNDGGGGTNSRIPAGGGFFTLPVSGTYIVVAETNPANQTGNYTLTLSAPTQPCTYTLGPANQSFTASANIGGVSIFTQSGCAWTAASNDPWITITAGASGSSSGVVNYAVAANLGNSRIGRLTIAGQTFTVTQAGTTDVLIYSNNFEGAVGSEWSHTNTDVTPLGARKFLGQFANNTVNLTLNNLPAHTSLKVSFDLFIILTWDGNNAVDGPDVWDLSVDGGPTLAHTTFSNITDFSGYDQAYPASFPGGSNPPLTGAAESDTLGYTFGRGTGSAVYRLSYTINHSASSLRLKFTGSGLSDITNESWGLDNILLTTSTGNACTFTLSPANQSFTASPNIGGVSVFTQSGCAWTAASNDGWITITANSSGTGNGVVAYSVAANNTGAQRTGTMTIAGQSFVVTQSACGFTLSPASQSFGAGFGTGGFSITTLTGCVWTAVSNDSWITITSASSGSGLGSLAYNVAANSGSARTGTISVAGQTFTVTQAGQSCSYAISPMSQNFGSNAGNGTVNVTAGSGCNWSAASNAAFITINSGASGSGNGSVNFAAAANLDANSRTGTMTIAGQTFTVAQSGTVATSRVVRVGGASGAPGSTVSVPIELVAQGDEVGLTFSLTFDPNVLSNPQAALGSDAPASATFIANTQQAGQGRLGIVLTLPAGQKFNAGTRQIALITFAIASGTSASSTDVGFGDQPVAREISDANGSTLPANYTGGAVILTSGIEADLTPRPNGNGSVSATDLVLLGRFVAGLESLGPGSEFQRADCAPRDTRGNGILSATDLIQAGRYAAGFDPLVPAGGPTAPVNLQDEQFAWSDRDLTTTSHTQSLLLLQQGRIMRVGNVSGAPGSMISVPVELVAQGNEAGLSFSLAFQPSVLTFVQAALGNGVPQNATFTFNNLQAAQGRLGAVITLPAGQSFPAGTRQLLVLNFTIAANAGGATTEIAFANQPVAREISDVSGNELLATYTSGIVTVGGSQNPVPTLTSLNPNTATAGGQGFTLTVNGANFVNGATVRWNGANRTTTFVSATQLTATIITSDIAAAGTASVTVVNPAPGGGVSNALTCTVSPPNPVPAITTLSPGTAVEGSAGFTLMVNGTGYVNGSVVRWDGSPRATSFISATQLTAQILPSDVIGTGQASVTVFNPAPGGGASNIAIFNITSGQNPAPTLTGISPNSATAGGPAFNLTANGANFVASSKVRWNGTDLATTLVNVTRLIAQAPANLIVGAGSAQVTVFTPTPGGGVTTAQTFTIQTPTVTSVSAASFFGAEIAPESIVAAFGVNLATDVAIASTVPLPTILLGTKVTVKDSAGTSRDAALFFVAPSQINYQVPPGTAEGNATVTVTINNNVVGAGAMKVAKVAPGLFTANASGTGIVSAVLLRIRNGVQTFETVSAAPIDLGPDTDTVYLLVYGTGMRGRTNAANISVNLGGTMKALNPNLFEDAFAVSGFVGLDQANIVLPRTLIGKGLINVVLTVDGKESNTVRISIR